MNNQTVRRIKMKTIKGTELVDKEFEVLEDGMLRLIEKKRTRYIPQVGEEYWYLNYGEVMFAENDDAYSDKWIINHQSVFRTEKECKEYKKFFELLNEYRCDLDWKDFCTNKHYLYYDNKIDKIYIGCGLLKLQGAFYFKSSKSAKEFIAKAGEDNIKRFMFDMWE